MTRASRAQLVGWRCCRATTARWVGGRGPACAPLAAAEARTYLAYVIRVLENGDLSQQWNVELREKKWDTSLSEANK